VGIDQDDSGFWRYPDLNLVKGSLYHLPIRTNVVYVAISRWVFEHLANPAAATTEIQRILKPKGLVLIIAPNLLNPLIMLSRILPLRFKQWMLYILNGIKKETVLKTYYRANTEGALDRLFREAGFEKVEFIYLGDPSYWLFSSFLFRCVVRTQGLAKFQLLRWFRMVMVGLYRKGDTETQSQGASQ
jgi:ubiquinone/menaquinone biosynthesis C-methylase UbiE